MELEVGSLVEGKVTGITKFGAFVALPGGKSGLVHISEIASSFVNDVHDHVQVGQMVKVRVIAVSEEGKINLSIKRAVENAPAQAHEQQPRKSFAAKPQRPTARPAERLAADGPSDNQEFEDRLKKFMQESDSRIADSRRYEQRTRSRRR